MAFVAIYQTGAGFHQQSSDQIAPPEGAMLRYSGDPAAVPQSLRDEIAAATPKTPQWGDFMDAIAPTLTDPLMAALGDRQQYLMLRLVRLENGKPWQGANDAVFTYWNTPTGPVLTEAQFNTLTTALADHHIPATATRDGVTGIVTIAHQP